MKYLLLLPFFHLFAHAAPKTTHHKHIVHHIHRSVSQHDPKIRTSETVKAYPVGRYSDPNCPEEMHERHTLYRREESSNWNYQSQASYPLPLGQLGPVARSNPSPSYYVHAEKEEMNAQQQAYAEALLEQNQALKKRIESMQQEEGKVPSLRQEIEKLQQQLDAHPVTPSLPSKPPEIPVDSPNENPKEWSHDKDFISPQ
jgi:hypothetical protein